MYLKSLELVGFKSFAKKSRLEFGSSISAIVGPNGSGKSNIAEAFRFVLGEQSMKSLRGKRGEDLIWNGSSDVPRANRASAKLVFNNERRLLDVDFEEVVIERVVHRDGSNTYSINGSAVRLRDIIELLAGANIGSSGHHIISQGEADRVLSAHPRERKEMIEDALGLKIYQYKKRESEKRLGKCEENISHVESLRKEIAPHLRFLKKQAEKVERSRALREELRDQYREYLMREGGYIMEERTRLREEKRVPEEELKKLDNELHKAEATLATRSTQDAKSEGVIRLEKELRELREEKEGLSRDLGRIEGQIAFEERRIEREKKRAADTALRSVPLGAIHEMHAEVLQHLSSAEASEDPGVLKEALSAVRNIFSSFLQRISESADGENETSFDAADNERLKKEHAALLKKTQAISERESSLEKDYAALQKEIEAGKSEERSAERAMFSIREKQNALRATLSALSHREASLARAEDDLSRERTEAEALLGAEFLKTISSEAPMKYEDEERNTQEERRRALEKMKIRLEEFGGGSGEEIIKEYQEIEERDQFLAREIADLERSAETLRELITDLERKLESKFKEGIVKINKEFQSFFSLMFGGGTAVLSVSIPQKRKRAAATALPDDTSLLDESADDEEEEGEEGVDINVSLPRKRIKGLVMLSGGERALTSIALLFAMSQVNPPPFLILDETDAALDEANSRRYGDMIENLSTYSQLILITHNRETMSRAGILYGVTMGGDGVSKLLSVSFDEAVAVAK